MARNFVQPGDVITLTAPADVKGGEIVTVGALTGVAAYDAKAGAEVEVALTGVFELPCSEALAQGALAYWADGKVAAEGDLLIGAVIAAAGSGAATCRVRLNAVTT
jgi:predicted RecA/RadA family phage recombinase